MDEQIGWALLEKSVEAGLIQSLDRPGAWRGLDQITSDETTGAGDANRAPHDFSFIAK